MPLTVVKCVQARPMVRARSFISAMKRGWLPAARSASAIAASLPDGSSRPCSIVRTGMLLPRGSSPTPEPV
jgi:hypothetical protein